MGIINRDIPAPPAWPPPREATRAADLLEYVHQRDPIGHRVHIALAMLHLLTLPLATMVKDLTLALLVAYALIRLPNTWRCYTPVLRDRLHWALFVWAAFFALTVVWSIDAVEGLTEVKAFRVIILPLALWPILDAAGLLIASLLAGVFAQNLVQFAQMLEVFGLKLMGADRARGLIHPIQTGAFNLAALTWYLAAMMRVPMGRDRRSMLMAAAIVVGAASAAAGLIFAGSRGSWAAGALVLPLAWLVLFVREPALRRRGLIVLAAGAAGLAIVLAAGGWRYIGERIDDTRRGFENVEADRDDPDRYTGSVGQRLMLAHWAWRFFTESPLYGHGAGSFRELSRETPEFRDMEIRWPNKADKDKFTPAHPHNAYLHMMVSAGVIGTILFLIVLTILIIRAWREPGDHLFRGAAIFVLLGWMLGTLFDCYTLNGHLFGLFAFIAAITMPRTQRTHRGDAESAEMEA